MVTGDGKKGMWDRQHPTKAELADSGANCVKGVNLKTNYQKVLFK
jgi:hypothetical protein